MSIFRSKSKQEIKDVILNIKDIIDRSDMPWKAMGIITRKGFVFNRIYAITIQKNNYHQDIVKYVQLNDNYNRVKGNTTGGSIIKINADGDEYFSINDTTYWVDDIIFFDQVMNEGLTDVFKAPSVDQIISRIPDEGTREIAREISNKYNIIFVQDSMLFDDAVVIQFEYKENTFTIRLSWKSDYNSYREYTLLGSDAADAEVFENFENIEELLQIIDAIKRKMNESVFSSKSKEEVDDIIISDFPEQIKIVKYLISRDDIRNLTYKKFNEYPGEGFFCFYIMKKRPYKDNNSNKYWIEDNGKMEISTAVDIKRDEREQSPYNTSQRDIKSVEELDKIIEQYKNWDEIN